MLRSPKFAVLLACLLSISVLGVSLPNLALAQTNACVQTYVVQKGDWLSHIAERYLGDALAYNTILTATNAAAKTDSSFATLTNANAIEVGQKLCIPSSTAIPGRENAGIYANVGPAADASALVEFLVLGGDGQVRDTLDYIGKAQIDAKGYWKQDGVTVTVQIYEQAGQAVKQTSTYTYQDNTLIASAPPNSVFTKTAPDVAFYSALYTTNRASADGKSTLTALTLLPNGQAQLGIASGTDFVNETGTWSVAKNPDTGTDAVTVDVKDPAGKLAAQNFVFQPQGTLLRGTTYNVDMWGTDLTFTKYQAPAQPETPASSGGQPASGQGGTAPIAGNYSAQLPAADAVGRVLVLSLNPDNSAALTTQFIGKGEPTVDKGTWANNAGTIAVTLNTAATGNQTLNFQFNQGALVLQDPVAAGYGSDGLTLKRTPTGNSRAYTYGGVSIRYDVELAQSATGATLPAVPVTVAPGLGGAMPTTVRIILGTQKPDDFFNPRLPQVLVSSADAWTKLDPSTAKSVSDLKTILADKPVSFTDSIPLLPVLPAQQVFRVQPHYLNFQNGSGVAFVTYYAQDASPTTADQIFYTFQGLTNDGKSYVAVFFPVTTAYLPTDANTALGGQSYNDWSKNYPTYLTNLVAGLNGLVPQAYTPDLDSIDALVQSIEVQQNP